jgi:hypothetical protein
MAMARAIADEAYDSGADDATGRGADTTKEVTADAALESALRLALAAREGFVMVPVEPTPEMLDAAYAGDREYTLRNFGDIMTVMQGPYDHWCAMIAAAPKGTT